MNTAAAVIEPSPLSPTTRETVRVMALGLRSSLRAQLVLIAGDLKRAGHSEDYIVYAMRSLIEEIRKEQR